MSDFGSTVDPLDVARFAGHSADWWDPDGTFRPLHQINAARLDFIRRQLIGHFRRDGRALAPFAGLRLADIGCGGGLVAEPMTRLGFTVTGIDADPTAIAVARDHAAAAGLVIEYQLADIDALVGAGERFDVVLALEIVEHVADRDAFFAGLGALVAPGGVLIGATLNRTSRAFAMAIVGAEYVLGWLPLGTHDWQKFVRPSEFVLGLRRVGFNATRLAGLAYDWRRGVWRETEDLAVNYMLVAVRR